MIIGIPREILERERRVAALPTEVAEYVRMGFTVLVEASAGAGALRSDGEYQAAGAEIVSGAAEIFSRADVILKVKQPHMNAALGKHEAELVREGAMLITFLHPAAPANHNIIRTLRDRNITALTMDSVPRIPRALPMDPLVSMSTITGYKAVINAASTLPIFVPRVETALGSTTPAVFVVVGAGVVGMQAIETAHHLGGRVIVFDIRAEARDHAWRAGAEIGGYEVPPELAFDSEGVARPLSEEWLAHVRTALAPLVAEADVLVLSSLVPGEVAPVLVTEEMVASMRPGSYIADVSIDQGGNCALTRPGEEVVVHGVTISGWLNIPGSVPVHASWMYSKNMLAFVQNLFKNGIDAPDLTDEIVLHTLVTRDRQIVHEGTLHAMRKEAEG